MGAWSEYKKQQEQERRTGKWTEYKQSGSYRKSGAAAVPAANVATTRSGDSSDPLRRSAPPPLGHQGEAGSDSLTQERYKAQGGVTFEQYKAAVDSITQQRYRAMRGMTEGKPAYSLDTPTMGALGRYRQDTTPKEEAPAIDYGDHGSDAAMEKWQGHWADDLFKKVLAQTPTDTEGIAKRGEMLSRMQWGEDEEKAAKALLKAAQVQNLTGNAYNPSDYAPAWDAYMRGNNEEYTRQVEIYDQLYARLHPKSTAFRSAAVESTGLLSMAKLGAAAAGDETGIKTLQSSEQAGKQAQAAEPGITWATKVGIGAGMALLPQSMLNPAAGALAKTALGATKLGQAAISAGQTALSFAAREAIQSAGGLATGEMTGGQFAQRTLASAAGGAAGSIASGLVSSGVAKLLTDKQMMTPFKEYLRQTAASATFSAANTGVSAVASGRKMTKEEIATELGMSFAFAMVDGYLSAMRSTKAASEQVKAKYDQITQEFDAIQNHMNGRQYATQEEYEQALRDLRTHVKELKAEVGSTYYAGQQEFVNDIQKGLDVAIGNINIMLAGDTGTAAAAAGTSGVGAQTVRLLTSEIEDAFRTGAGDTPNTPVTGGAPESTAVNDNPTQHTPAEQQVIEEYKGAVDERLKATIEKYQSGEETGFARFGINDVSERQAADAGRLLGGEYVGYTNAINSNGIRHTLKEHGAQGTVDHSMADVNDFSRIGYVLHNYDNVEKVTYKSGDDDLSAEFRTQDNKPAAMLRYSKKINGTYFVVEAVPQSKHKKFWVVSAYIGTGSGTQAPDATKDPRNTPNASLASSLPAEYTVTQNPEAVKRDEWLPENMDVEDDIPSNMDVIDEDGDGLPDNMELEGEPSQSPAATALPKGEPRGGGNARQVGTENAGRTEASAPTGAQETVGANGEPEVRTVLRQAGQEDVRGRVKGDKLLGKVGDTLREYKARLKEYDARTAELRGLEEANAQQVRNNELSPHQSPTATASPRGEAINARVRELREQITQDEAYLEAKERDMQDVASVARARLENERQQKELGRETQTLSDKELRETEQSAQAQESAAELAASRAAEEQDAAELERIAKQREYGFAMTQYFISGYFDANDRVQMDIPTYAEAVRVAYGKGRFGWKFKREDSQRGIADEVLQEAYKEGRRKGEENGTAGIGNGGERDAGMDSDEPSGRVGRGAGGAEKESAGGFGVKESLRIQSVLGTAKAERLSPKADGIENGSEQKMFYRVPEEMVQEYPALKQAKQILTDAGADDVRLVSGSIRIRTAGGREMSVQGVTQGTTVWLTIDAKDGVIKTAEHEAMHLRLEAEPGLRERLIDALGLSQERRDKLARKYCEAYEGCYTGEDMSAYLDEIVCDAYAGINRMGLGADKLQSSVRAAADSTASQRTKKPAQTRGPPEGKLSVGTTKDGRPVAVVDSDILSHMDTTTWDKAKMREAQGAARTALLAFKDGVEVQMTNYEINRQSRREYTRSDDTARLYRKDKSGFADKMRAADAVDDIIVATTDWSRDGKLKHPRTDDLVDFLHGDVLIRAGNNQYVATTVVGITDAGKYVFYDVTGMTPTTFTEKTKSPTTASGKTPVGDIQGNSVSNSVRGEEKNVNRKYSPDSENDRRKAAQFAVIQSSNAAEDDYHTWIRSADEIKTFDEALRDPEWADYDSFDPDYTAAMAREALKSGTITVYSSKRIGKGTFVTPSRMEAESYAANGKVFEKTVPLGDVAWIDPTQGQYAPVAGAKLSPETRDANAEANVAEEQNGGSSDPLRRSAPPPLGHQGEASETGEKPKVYSYDKLPGKARAFVDQAVNSAVRQAANAMSIPGKAKREVLKPAVQGMMNEFLKTGRIAQETIDKSFEDAYDAGIEEDREFYDTFKHIKVKLLKTGIRVTPEVRAEFADLEQFRRAVRGKILLNNEGIGIDTLYGELHDEAPGLFPEAIINPADQLMRMIEVADKIQITKQTLDEAHRGDGGDYKRWARNDFEAAVEDMKASLRTARAWAESRERTKLAQEAPKSQAEVEELYKRQREARRAYERVQSRNLLTDEDERILDRLLRGELAPGDIQDRENARSILNVYEAKADYAALTAQIARWRRGVKEGYREQVRPLLTNSEQAKDKKGLAPGFRYDRETAERNIEDVFPAADAKRINETIFEPVHTQQAKSTRFKNEYRARVRKLDLSRRVKAGDVVSEAHAVQLYGEAMDNIRQLTKRPMDAKRDGKTLAEWEAVVRELWEKNPGIRKEKVERAVGEFRRIYDELFTQMNDVRVRNGYEPIDYRKGYFPHFQPGQTDGVLAVMGKALGIKADVTALPTTINGLTHTFKPGITWFGNAQERLGFSTAYDAVEGFDKYIEGAADIVFQTDNIQRLRAFASEVRYRTSNEGVRERVDAIRADDSISEQDKELRIKDLYENAKFELSGFAAWLDEYTNLLANKKSKLDRGVESVLGRGFYNAMNWLESRAAANMVAMNPGSWLTNFIPLTQAWGYVSTGDMVQAMGQTLAAMKDDDGFWGRSAFLTNRRGSDPLVRTWQGNLSAKLSMPMEWIDTFTADTIVRARYNQNLRRGMLEEDAMREADRFAANIMADRSKGATPTRFQAKNPFTKLFTQFQLEVNNQFSNIFKDLPREMRKRGLQALAWALFKMFFSAWAYNELYEKVVGRRAALDPIDMTNELVGDATGYKLNNVLDVAFGSEAGFIHEGKPAGFGNTVTNFLTSTAEELPMVGGVLGGGRVPFSSALPDVSTIWKVATNKELDSETKNAKLWEEVRDPLLYLGLPFGGGQIRKVAQGIYAVAKGGKFYRNNKGELQMQYPVFTDEGVMTVLRDVQAGVFGRNATKEARDWVQGGFSKLSTKETNAYLAMSAADVKQREAWKLIQAMKDVDVPEGVSKKAAKLEALRDYDISDEAKALYYYNVIASDTERAQLDAYMDLDEELADEKVQSAINNAEATAISEEEQAAKEARAERDRASKANYAQMYRKIRDLKLDGYEPIYKSQLKALKEQEGLSDSDARKEIQKGVIAEVKEAFQSGSIDEKMATRILSKNLNESEDDTYWMLEEWKGGPDYSKYGKLTDAMEQNTDAKETVQYYLSHGVQKRDISSQITRYFKPLYKAAETRQEKNEIARQANVFYRAAGYMEKWNDMMKWDKEDS